jgi:small subunit ribosomal protein S6
MFLFDPTFADNYANVEKELERIMERAGAKMIVAGKWDERKLAYEIKKRRRGCYVLTYFEADPERIRGIERDCQLSESILRVMILSAENIPREWMEQSVRRQVSTKSAEAESSDSEDRGSGASASGEAGAKESREPETVEAGSSGEDKQSSA